MYIIEVIPIAKNIGADTLSYFTSNAIPLGAIVNVPLRKKIIQGIVVSIYLASDIKSEIKSAQFALKKIDKVKSIEFFRKEFIDTASYLADYYATSVGSIIDTLVPDYILKNIDKIKNLKSESSDEKNNNNTKSEKFVVQGDDEERYGEWKSLIRQEFAKKKSLLFIYPTIEDSERAYELLEKGVPGYVFILHGSLPIKKIIETWNHINEEKHPVVVIATGGFFSLSRNDIETMIIERESSKSYKVQRRPYIDIRQVAEVYADKMNMKLYFADNFLRLETLYRESQGELVQASPFKFRSLSTASDILIDMKEKKAERVTYIESSDSPNKAKFNILSEEIEKLIKKTKDESEHMIILATRRGLSPSTVCGDCQTIVTCNNCSSPVVLHKAGLKDDKNFFMCHRCGDRRSAAEYCKHCGSWKLAPLGIGIDMVIEKIKEKFPDISIFKIDSDSTSKVSASKKDTGAKDIVQKFKSQPGSILIGTEMMLQYVHDKVENSAIISLDSLFALPDFRIQEKILYMLIRIRAITTKIFIVQTRKAEEKVFEYGLKGNMSDFYRNTVDDREKFDYPPFTTLIKITLEGKKDEIVKDMENVQNILDPFEVEVFPAFTNTVKGNFVLHGLIRISNINNKWPNDDLVSKIRQLSPAVTVKVDPETLL